MDPRDKIEVIPEEAPQTHVLKPDDFLRLVPIFQFPKDPPEEGVRKYIPLADFRDALKRNKLIIVKHEPVMSAEEAGMTPWTEWMRLSEQEGRYVFRGLAEREQIELEDAENCRIVKVRGVTVGAIDFESEVALKLSSEGSPSLTFTRKGTDFFAMTFLHEWRR